MSPGALMPHFHGVIVLKGVSMAVGLVQLDALFGRTKDLSDFDKGQISQLPKGGSCILFLVFSCFHLPEVVQIKTVSALQFAPFGYARLHRPVSPHATPLP